MKLRWALGLMVLLGTVVTGEAQDTDEIDSIREGAAEMFETLLPSADTIEEITGTIRLLREGDYRPTGPTTRLSLEDAIEIAVQENPAMRIARSDVIQSLAQFDLTESTYNGLYDVSARFDEQIQTFASSGFRFDPNQGVVSDNTERSENREVVTFGPRYRQQFQNGAFVDITPGLEWEHDTDGAFNRSASNQDGDRTDLRGNYAMSFQFPIMSRTREEIRTDLENSRINTVLSDHGLYLQERQTVESTINNYWNVKALEEQLNIQNERLLQSMQIEFVRRTQYEFDQVSQLQLGEAQIDVLNQQSDLINREGNLRNAVELFNILLGIPVETNLVLSEPLEAEPLPYAPAEYVRLVTSSNLELEDLRLRIRQSANSLHVATLGQQPQLNFVTDYFINDEGDENINFGLVFNWNFGDGGATRARIRSTLEGVKQLQINLWNRERTLIQQTYNDLRELQLQEQRIMILEQNVEQSQRALDNALFSFFEFGEISFRDLQDFQIDLANSRSQLVSALVQFNVAKSSLLAKVHDYSPSTEVSPILSELQADEYLEPQEIDLPGGLSW